MSHRQGVIYNGDINGVYVTIRYATHADYDNVMKIDENVYDGSDYLPTTYHEALNDPASHAFLAEVEGVVIAFACYILAGANYIMTFGTAGRMSPKYRNRNVFITFTSIAKAEMKRMFPKLQVNWGMARYCDQMVRNTLNSNGRVIDNWTQVLHTVLLHDIREVGLCTDNGRVDVTVVSVSDVMAVLNNRQLLDRLYPHGFMLTAAKFQPVPTSPEHIRKVIQMSHVHMSGEDDTLGLSTVYMYSCSYGVILIICYSGHEAMTTIKAHIIQALRHCATLYGLSPTHPSGTLSMASRIGVVVSFPTSISCDDVSSFLRTTLPSEIPVELMHAGLFETPY